MHWGECPTWENFQVNNFEGGPDLSKNPCDYFVKGKIKASTLSLSVLVLIEMLNAFNAISEDHSLFTMTPFVNLYLFAATAVSMGLHFVIVYIPILADIFSITALSLNEWWLVFAFSFPVIIIDEILKVFGRQMQAADLKRRLAKKKIE
jgi:Ca2+-transporting ATPase